MRRSPAPEQLTQPDRSKPPRGVTFLSLGVLTIAGFYAIRMGLAFLRWNDLVQFPGVSPGFIAGESLVWTVLAASVWWGLRQRKSWAPPITRLAALVYSIFSWLERWILASNLENGFFGLQWRRTLPVNWPFLLVLNLACIVLVFWILSKQHVKELFGDFHAQKP